MESKQSWCSTLPPRCAAQNSTWILLCPHRAGTGASGCGSRRRGVALWLLRLLCLLSPCVPTRLHRQPCHPRCGGVPTERDQPKGYCCRERFNCSWCRRVCWGVELLLVLVFGLFFEGGQFPARGHQLQCGCCCCCVGLNFTPKICGMLCSLFRIAAPAAGGDERD